MDPCLFHGDRILRWSRRAGLKDALLSVAGELMPRAPLPQARAVQWWDAHYAAAWAVLPSLPLGPTRMAVNGGEPEPVEVCLPRVSVTDAVGPNFPWSRASYLGCEIRKGIVDPQDVRTHVRFDRCTFTDTLLLCGRLPHAEFVDCRFIRSGTGFITGGATFLRCHWEGIPVEGGHPIQIMGPDVAVLDCTVRDADRGLVVNTRLRDVTGCLVSGLLCDGLQWSHNGCEGVAVEGEHRFADNLLLHLRYRNGEGPGLLLYDAPCEGNLTRDFAFDGGEGVRLDGEKGAAQAGNVFAAGEVRGGRVLGPHLDRNLWRLRGTAEPYHEPNDGPVRVIGSRPTRGSKFDLSVEQAADTVAA